MKRIFAFLFALTMFCSGASADTLREQIKAPEHATGEWYSNTGKSRVTVDAAVIVPEVESISTYDVTGRDWTLEDVRTLALAAAPESAWDRDWQRDFFWEGAEWSGKEEDPFVVSNAVYSSQTRMFLYRWDLTGEAYPYAMCYGFNNYLDTVFGLKRSYAQLDFRYEYGYNHPYFYSGGVIGVQTLTIRDNEALAGQTLTLGQAKALAETCAAQVSPSFHLYAAQQVSGEITYHDAKKNTYNNTLADRNAYSFIFTRVIDGISVTVGGHSALDENPDNFTQEYVDPPQYERLTCIVDQDRIVVANWQFPWIIGEKTQDAVALLPFDQILEVFGAICPLSIQSMEKDGKAVGGKYGNSWTITEIRLGYMPVLRKDSSGKWELRPVWDFIGIRAFATEYYDWPHNVALTIDAIDGTVIDRNYGY